MNTKHTLVGPSETTAMRNVLIGGTAALAFLDGGLGNLVVCSALGGAGFVAHQAMTSADIEQDKRAIIASVEDDDARKEKKHDAQTREELRAIARKLHADQNIAYCTSVGMGILTFLNPLIGLGLIGALALGRCRNRNNA